MIKWVFIFYYFFMVGVDLRGGGVKNFVLVVFSMDLGYYVSVCFCIVLVRYGVIRILV